MTLHQLRADVYRRLGFGQFPDPAVVTRVTAFCNETHRDLLTDPALTYLRDDVITFASVASQQRYALPQAIARVNRIWETTNDKVLQELSLGQLRQIDPDPQTGTPEAYVPLSYTAVAKQPADASELFVKSGSANDTSQLVTVEGFITGGYPARATVTLTGTTAVSLNTAITAWTEVTRFFLSATAEGVVTLHEDSGAGTELARIAAGQLQARYFSVLLWPTPSAIITYSVDYTREITDMEDGGDEPLLPPDFHRLVAIGARKKEYEFQDDTRLMVAIKEYNDGLTQLRRWIHERESRRIVPGMLPSRGRSNLGAWYPSGTW